ncbi:MAG: LamG-like jellyroll fold domain-containing protein, partial [Verrucomicrobiota bacterium]
MMHLYRFTRDSVVGKPRAAEGPRSLAAACATWFAAVLGMLAMWATSPAVRAQSMAANNLMAVILNNSGFTTANITMGGNVTVEGWVYHTGAWDQWTRMVEMAHTTFDWSNAMNFTLSSGSTGKPFMEIWAGSTQSTLTAPNAIPLNTWTHVAFVVSGNTLTIYVNGTSVATGTGTAASSLSRRISIGRNFNGGNAINGHLADVRIWSVARSATEINASMPVGSVTGATTGLVAAWPFGATGAAVLGDVSGNNRTLSEQGTVYYWKGGSGTLVSTGQNSYAGLLTIWSGTLQVGNGGTAGTLGSGRVINN